MSDYNNNCAIIIQFNFLLFVQLWILVQVFLVKMEGIVALKEVTIRVHVPSGLKDPTVKKVIIFRF